MDASGVPDHRRLYALSDPNAKFQSNCDHLHDDSCAQCTELKEVISTTKSECKNGPFLVKDRGDMLHTIKRERNDIMS